MSRALKVSDRFAIRTSGIAVNKYIADQGHGIPETIECRKATDELPQHVGEVSVVWRLIRKMLDVTNAVIAEITNSPRMQRRRRPTEPEGADIRGRTFTRSSRSAATADFDGDGDLDIAVNNFNHEPYLLRNDSPKGNYIKLKLRGRKANSDAVGARVKVTAGGRTWHRRVCGAEGYITQSSLLVHIGLGRTSKVDSVDVYWPGHTKPQTLRSPAVNEVVEIVQE